METIYNFITGSSLTLYLLAFIAVSYALVALLTWSPIKPLKYLGFPIIIVGIVSFGLKSILNLAVDNFFEDSGTIIIKTFINSSGNIFMKYAIICIVVGVLMVTSYYVLNRVLKSYRKKKDKDYAFQNSYTQEYIPEPYNDEIEPEDGEEIIDD